MSDEKDSDTSIEASVAVDVKAGTLAASTKVNGVTRFFRTMFPEFTAKGRLKHVVVDNIERQLVSGKPLGELTPAEQQVVASALSNELRKAANRAAILEQAYAIEPKVAGLFESPGIKALPSAAAPVAFEHPSVEPAPELTEEQQDEQVLFWERFWADAEVISVPYMQEVYAQMMTGQFKSPGSFALKTLDVLRCLDGKTARLFRHVATFRIGLNCVPYPLQGQHNLGYGRSELDRLAQADLVGHMPRTLSQGDAYRVGSLFIRGTTENELINVSVFGLTRAGMELAEMLDLPVERSTVMTVCEALSGDNLQCEVANRKEGPWMPWKDFFNVELAERATRRRSESAPHRS
jgi:hypothetical protein